MRLLARSELIMMMMMTSKQLFFNKHLKCRELKTTLIKKLERLKDYTGWDLRM